MSDLSERLPTAATQAIHQAVYPGRPVPSRDDTPDDGVWFDMGRAAAVAVLRELASDTEPYSTEAVAWLRGLADEIEEGSSGQ